MTDAEDKLKGLEGYLTASLNVAVSTYSDVKEVDLKTLEKYDHDDKESLNKYINRIKENNGIIYGSN